MIKINTRNEYHLLGSSFYPTEIPPTKDIKKLLVDKKYVKNRLPYIPDFGEITYFTIAKKEDTAFIIPRRNYKITILPKEIVNFIEFDFTHLLIATKIFNNLVIEDNKIKILSRNPFDNYHPLTIIVLGDGNSDLSLKKEIELLKSAIIL